MLGHAGAGAPPPPGPSSPRRALATVLTVLMSGGAATVCVIVALFFAAVACEDGCAPGSRWARGAGGLRIELWALAVPALLASGVLTWTVSTGRRWLSLLAWAAMSGLLLGWCVFTGVSSLPVGFHGADWAWPTGLLLATIGGLTGVAITFAGSRA